MLWDWDQDDISANEDERTAIIGASKTKDRVAARRLGSDFTVVMSDMQKSNIDDAMFRKYAPTEHREPISRQALVTNLKYVITVAAAECVILYSVLIRFQFMQVITVSSTLTKLLVH